MTNFYNNIQYFINEFNSCATQYASCKQSSNGIRGKYFNKYFKMWCTAKNLPVTEEQVVQWLVEKCGLITYEAFEKLLPNIDALEKLGELEEDIHIEYLMSLFPPEIFAQFFSTQTYPCYVYDVASKFIRCGLYDIIDEITYPRFLTLMIKKVHETDNFNYRFFNDFKQRYKSAVNASVREFIKEKYCVILHEAYIKDDEWFFAVKGVKIGFKLHFSNNLRNIVDNLYYGNIDDKDKIVKFYDLENIISDFIQEYDKKIDEYAIKTLKIIYLSIQEKNERLTTRIN